MPLTIECGEHRAISTEGVRAPHLFPLRNGDLLLTFHVDPDMHFPKRICMRSTDKGRTWRKDPQRSYKEMAWGEGPDGTVLAFDRDTFEKCPGSYLGTFYRSTDGGETFSGPHESEVGVKRVASRDYPVSPEHYPEEDHVQRKFFGPLPDYYKPIVKRTSCRRGPGFWRYMMENNGRWLATMQGRFHGDTAQRTILVTSKDQGNTWRFVNTVAYEHNKAIDGLCEPVMRRVADGSLLCMMRRGGKQPMAQCRSTDGGETWSPPELQVAHGVDPDLCLMSNGVLACTYGRPGLHIMFSEDGCGFGWGYRTHIGDWSSSSYMGMAEISPGKLLVVYDRRKDSSPGAGRDPEKCYIGAITVTVERYTLPPAADRQAEP